ncbi:hypothetical protein C0581_04185 [Candidatus Parcubacteria bacterium]|nr:MAG: hypothetical protein C0581_04185 [Candidatus Parcubacteria bacterium]
MNYMSVNITYFVHGTTTDNEEGLATGWNPGELSELGQDQSKQLTSLVSDKKFDIVFCSDLKRAIDSAQFAFGDIYKIVEDERLRECNYGDWNGAPGKNFKHNMNEFVDTVYPNGESYRDVENRINSFVEFLKNNFDGKHIAIVAHQAPQLALDVLLRHKTWEEAIDEDWRKTKSWQPGWEYIIE